MRKLFYFLLFQLFVACSGKPSGPDAASLAAQAAKVYYDQLLKGDYGSFVDGRYQPTRIPESLRQQLIANAKMFVAQQEKEHNGIKSVSVTDGRADTAHHVANAFLTFSYGDGTKEQVVVPMVEVKKVWYMR
ncbi:MAG TPA: hypothetical protein DEQ17_03045 [Prevotella sp.]|nr:hypothetical protein [Prevotella sp.]